MHADDTGMTFTACGIPELRHECSLTIPSLAFLVIGKIKPFVPVSTLINVYQSIVDPYFDYCSIVWMACDKCPPYQ